MDEEDVLLRKGRVFVMTAIDGRGWISQVGLQIGAHTEISPDRWLIAFAIWIQLPRHI